MREWVAVGLAGALVLGGPVLDGVTRIGGVGELPGGFVTVARAQEMEPAALTAPAVPASIALGGITVTGDGLVALRPDVVTLRMGVETTATSPAAAVREARQTAERVVQRLRAMGVSEGDIQLKDLDVSAVQEEEYLDEEDEWPAPARSGGTGTSGSAGTPSTSSASSVPSKPKMVLTSESSVAIVVRLPGTPDAARLAQLLEGAEQAGVTSVEGVSYEVRDLTALHRQALAAAMRDARSKAEEVASLSGVQLQGVRSVIEQSFGSSTQGSAYSSGDGEGILAGEDEMAVRVRVTFDVAVAGR